MDDETRMERLRALPSIDELLARPSLSSLLASHARPVAVAALREAVASVRARVLGGEDALLNDADVARAFGRVGRPKLGVVSKEVTLLPRHWEWLGRQPGGGEVLGVAGGVAGGVVEDAVGRSDLDSR